MDRFRGAGPSFAAVLPAAPEGGSASTAAQAGASDAWIGIPIGIPWTQIATTLSNLVGGLRSYAIIPGMNTIILSSWKYRPCRRGWTIKVWSAIYLYDKITCTEMSASYIWMAHLICTQL